MAPADAPLAPGETIDPMEHAARLTAQGVTISRVRFSELRQVARIQEQAFTRRLAYSMPTLVLLFLLPGIRFLAARHNGQIAGCVIGDRYDFDARVINLAVAPDARRLGIGAGLLFALERSLPHGDIVLMVERDNPGAQRLYQRAGYTEVGFAQDYYGRNQHGHWMRKRRGTNASKKIYV